MDSENAASSDVNADAPPGYRRTSDGGMILLNGASGNVEVEVEAEEGESGGPEVEESDDAEEPIPERPETGATAPSRPIEDYNNVSIVGGPSTPAQAEQTANCNTGPYFVFFEYDSSRITSEATRIVDLVARNYRSGCRNARVQLAGHMDTSGSASYAVGLSSRMAQSVANALEQRNIPASLISTEGFGESQLRVPTADGVREAQNRRVEIRFSR